MIEDGFEVAFFCDLETTGTDTIRNEILTASLSVCDYRTLEEIDSIELKFRPRFPAFWEKEAEEKAHKIPLGLALTFPDNRVSTIEMYDFLKRHMKTTTQPMICHALKFAGYFDTAFLESHFYGYGAMFLYRRICGIHQSTITYAKEWSKESGVNPIDPVTGEKSFSLDALCAHFGIPLDHHNATSDRKACQALYKLFREAECKTLDRSMSTKPAKRKSASKELPQMTL